MLFILQITVSKLKIFKRYYFSCFFCCFSSPQKSGTPRLKHHRFCTLMFKIKFISGSCVHFICSCTNIKFYKRKIFNSTSGRFFLRNFQYSLELSFSVGVNHISFCSQPCYSNSIERSSYGSNMR